VKAAGDQGVEVWAIPNMELLYRDSLRTDCDGQIYGFKIEDEHVKVIDLPNGPNGEKRQVRAVYRMDGPNKNKWIVTAIDQGGPAFDHAAFDEEKAQARQARREECRDLSFTVVTTLCPPCRVVNAITTTVDIVETGKEIVDAYQAGGEEGAANAVGDVAQRKVEDIVVDKAIGMFIDRLLPGGGGSPRRGPKPSGSTTPRSNSSANSGAPANAPAPAASQAPSSGKSSHTATPAVAQTPRSNAPNAPASTPRNGHSNGTPDATSSKPDATPSKPGAAPSKPRAATPNSDVDTSKPAANTPSPTADGPKPDVDVANPAAAAPPAASTPASSNAGSRKPGAHSGNASPDADPPARAARSEQAQAPVCNGACFTEDTLVVVPDQVVFEHGVATSVIAGTTVRISSIQLGSRVLGENPNDWDVDTTLPEPDSETWVCIAADTVGPNGKLVEMEFLRPRDWAEANDLKRGSRLAVHYPELELTGWLDIRSVTACPPIAGGEGHVVTGRFFSPHAENVIRLTLEDGNLLDVTETHPIWSADRGKWVPAGKLQIGELLDGDGRTVAVEQIVFIGHAPAVYNLETHGQHVYRVSGAAILVHNNGTGGSGTGGCPPTNLPAPEGPKHVPISGQARDPKVHANPSYVREPAPANADTTAANSVLQNKRNQEGWPAATSEANENTVATIRVKDPQNNNVLVEIGDVVQTNAHGLDPKGFKGAGAVAPGHAEAGTMFDANSKVSLQGKDVEIFTDGDPCRFCDFAKGIEKTARNLGVRSLTVFSPSWKITMF
jgi:hypothetical protein